MKSGIALYSFGSEQWIGGVYYIRNMAFQLSQNKSIVEKYTIFIFTSPNLYNVFEDLPKSVRIIKIKYNKFCNFLRIILLKLLRVKYVYPSMRDMRNLGIKGIAWIPDFQVNKLENTFDDLEKEKKIKENEMILNSPNPIILSSYDCLNDFIKYYNADRNDIYVVPFVSYIEPQVRKISENEEKRTLEKYKLTRKRYACVMNQFWKHKNHKLVFEAIVKYYEKHPESEFIFTLTGKLDDYRNPEYIDEIKKLLNLDILSNRVFVLGLLPRNEQLIVMKSSEFIIQPSLCEGWGTVVEDAKVLDKTILLSDITIHREQMNEKCILFNPHNANELFELIEKEIEQTHRDCIEDGIKNMNERAIIYSKEFEKLLGC